ncbi:MAG: NFACT RNA binding domain-containing protein [Chloroflexota bacterium]
MNFDYFTIAAVVDELTQTIQGGRVQDTLEIGEDAIGLEIYYNHARRYLLISAHPVEARIHLVSDRVRRGVETPSPLGLMLRRYVEDGKLIAISQPAWERIIHLEFEGAEGLLTLIVEPMQRRSNILLVREGRIMDCLRRVGSDENRVRVSLPGHPYVPPPPQINKHLPTDLSYELIQQMLDSDPSKAAWRALTDTIIGFSPMLAKEAVYRAMQRATLKAGDTSARDLYSSTSALLEPLFARKWQPGITEADGQITSFAAYPITFLPGWREIGGISEAVAEFYGAPVGIEAYDAGKKPIQAVIVEAQEKIEHKLESLLRSFSDESEREHLRQSGELLLAYQYQITPGQTSFSAQYDFDKPALDIKIDPTMSALDNAKEYFDKYERSKRAAAEIPALIKATQVELDFLRQLETDLMLAANWPEIGEVQDALQLNGYWRGSKTARPKGGKSGPLKVTTPDSIVIWVGRNARQNEDVTFTKGRPEDLWLHAHGVPGAHVIIKTNGRAVNAGVLQRAAELAAYYSASRGEGRVLVDVTERRYVRKIKGGKPGMVTYKNESPIDAVPTGETSSKMDL